MMTPTFGQNNSPPKTGPIIINEVMYHPPEIAGNPPTDNARDEFVELHNITMTAQGVGGWRLKGDADFVFAAGTTIQPGEYVLLVTFNPSTDTAARTAFLAAYHLSEHDALRSVFAEAGQRSR